MKDSWRQNSQKALQKGPGKGGDSIDRRKVLMCSMRGRTFQKGSMPWGRASLKAFNTLQVSTTMNAMEMHIEASMTPKRGLVVTSSHRPKLYSRLMV